MRKRWTIGRVLGCLASLLWTCSVVASCRHGDDRTVHAKDVEAWTRAVERGR
ncbi:MAG: hypothetical protein LDL56_09060 [Armatimonadetes bacterium]|nr:hypothetical protein [Armatimonadota bacterium]MCA1997362.1 hypothetical protein [Armatimonadota bacterium]